MAIRLSLYSAPSTVTLSHASIKGSRNSRLFMCASPNNNNHHHHTSGDLQTRSSHGQKFQVVFEDKAQGIICYEDENGEITCEGYDEGPRLQHHQISRFVDSNCDLSNDVETLEMLQRCMSQDRDTADKETTVGKLKQKCFDYYNGFNKLR